MKKKKLNLVILGASGRMGQEILSVAEASGLFGKVMGYSRSGSADGFEFCFDRLEKIPNEVNVVIDFTLPEAINENLKWAIQRKIPYVCGVTGISTEHHKSIEKASKKIPVLWASNMSLGITWLNMVIAEFEKVKHFDFQVEELHHSKKKDSPSGTAKTIQENLVKAISKKIPPPVSIRGGGIFGIHKIYAMSEEEVITLEHTALNRRVFAKGAVAAAEFVLKQSPGLYKMSDVLLAGEK